MVILAAADSGAAGPDAGDSAPEGAPNCVDAMKKSSFIIFYNVIENIVGRHTCRVKPAGGTRCKSSTRLPSPPAGSPPAGTLQAGSKAQKPSST
jgi:hypothetical protein